MLQPWSWLYLVCFLDLFGASLIVPVFSTHLRSLGISHMDIGLLSSVYGFAQLISGPVIGSWSDIYGRRIVMFLTIIVCCVSYGLMGIVSSFHMFLIVRCVLGLFKHTQTLCRACIADIVPPETQVTVHGLVNAFTSFSFMFGPVISGFLMETDKGFQSLSSVVFLIFLLNASAVFVFADNKSKTDINVSDRLEGRIFLVFKELFIIDWKKFWALFSIKFILALASDLFFKNMGIILMELYGITPVYMGYTISFYGFVSVVSNLCVGQIKKLLLSQRTYLTSLACVLGTVAISFVWLYIASNYTQFVVGMVPLAFSHSLARVLLTEMVLERSDDSCRGSVIGAASSVASVARTVAPLLSGLILSLLNLSSVLIASSLIALSGSLFAVIYSQQRQTHHKST
ncbi:major facilitator superfamily domain-containing protein 9-like isoform X2 [Homalodisca vitripennis]|uniref:major facilitator superfamily domain-containing protein 9-like isoform X2 n=1 Tax=Homalodisca vitripennis TaxID=197043 RepID=UPI001EEA9FFF|nr:major facilitator superfamily domain-containing protein 9-like isoform X2 [Homalodisca vitripennis]KAG8329278.1 transporter activity protein [Homalodisca vitripennis]